ncbi:class E sortase [Streptomyces sp. NPDC051907]|uniref:class E sortase n=1 Tax=Streptomyces sp. NPDC051907 TaxID=3155284 RepID=UPI0034299875
MSAVRPEHEHEYDPLTDPLPPGEPGSPWYRAADGPEAEEARRQPQPQPEEWYDPQGYQQDWYAQSASDPIAQPADDYAAASRRTAEPFPEQRATDPYAEQRTESFPGQRTAEPFPGQRAAESFSGPFADQRTADPYADQQAAKSYADPFGPIPGPGGTPVPDDETVALRTSDTRRATEVPGRLAAEVPAGPGRAERRRAAAKSQSRGRRRPEPATGAQTASATASDAPSRPLTRMEARRAARALKDSPAVVASRVIGELFITFGVLMLLFVSYQLWWTNILAGQQASRETNKIQDEWAKGRKPGAFEPGQGFAIMYIPKLDVVVPIAEGINKPKVLDRGMVGHYGEGKLKTAMPADKQGNFAVAGHRNTHGEPFRYINRLEPGDPIVVETQDAYYTYTMASILPQTSPKNVGVIAPVPAGSTFTGPGRYITLTTCTPEFTSTYRMIVWGKMVEERPRSKGRPDALVG